MKLRVLLVAAIALAVGACGSSDRSSMRTVDLTAHYSRWSVDHLTVRTGTVVRFVARNNDPIDHELIVGDEAVQARHENGTESHHEPKPGEVSVPAGKTAETMMQFTQPGEFVFACHLPGHFAYGMHGTITVT